MMKLAVLVLMIACTSAWADDTLKELQQGNLEFSSALYKEIIKNIPGENVIVSPLSIQIVLALAQLGAKGDTALEMTKGLHLPDSPEKVKEAFKQLLPKLKGDQYYKLESANKVYLKEDFKLNEDFKKLSEEVFDAGVEQVDFVDTVGAAEKINKWVESKTNEKIKDLIVPDMLDALTRLVLVNAVYFKANWSSPFDDYSTQKRKFFKSEKEEIEVDTMHLTETFRYAENKDLDARFLELPYESDEVTFTIVLPNQKEGLKSVESRLNEVLQPQNYTYERVQLYLPKFKIESTFKLIPALKELGIKKAFDDNADLSGFLAVNEPLKITEVVHKAFINLTESGTEAAAATAVALNRVLFVPSDTIDFKVEHPFLYFIKVAENIIFFGRLSSPVILP